MTNPQGQAKQAEQIDNDTPTIYIDSGTRNEVPTKDEIRLVQWQTNVINRISEAIKRGENVSDLTFTHYAFPPEHIELYQDLQKKIAEILPEEYKRPTIILHVRGKNRPFRLRDEIMIGDTPDFGLLGGTGPLSDAEIMCQLIDSKKQSGSLDDTYLLLTSAPPPRPEEKKASKRRYLAHTAHYLQSLFTFTSADCSHYALLSNTAHKNAGVFTTLLSKPERFVHLVDRVADNLSISTASQEKKILVLGTTEAADVNLYPERLAKRNLVSVMPRKDTQKELQSHIDAAKSGNAENVGKKLIDLIFNEIKRTHPTHVLLSCTELPLLLKALNPETSRMFKDELQEKIDADPELSKTQIQFVDTEEKMVETISQLAAQAEKDKASAYQQEQTATSSLAKSSSLPTKNIEDYLVVDKTTGMSHFSDQKIQAAERDSINSKVKQCLQSGIEQYLSTSTKGFFSFLHTSTTEAEALKRALSRSDSLETTTNLLFGFFNSYKGNIRSQSLKTLLLQSLLGPLSTKERKDWCEQIPNGGVNDLITQYTTRIKQINELARLSQPQATVEKKYAYEQIGVKQL